MRTAFSLVIFAVILRPALAQTASATPAKQTALNPRGERVF